MAWISVSRPGSSRAAQITTWAPSGTPSSADSLINRSARTVAGSKRSRLMPGRMVSIRSASTGMWAIAFLAM